jgi:hypothetical protein
MDGLINRDADNWRALFAIADLIGSDWPERAREAAAALTPKDSESIGPMLLADIKAAFDEHEVDRLSSTDVCTALNNMEGKPWGDWKGKELTPNQLARLLKPFAITTNTTIRVGSKTAKGYHRHQFEEVWQRYLAREGGQGADERSQGNNADEMGTSSTFQKVTAESDVTFQTCEKPPSNGHCYRVTDENEDRGGSGARVGGESHKCAQCGKDGADYWGQYGSASGYLHRGACEAGWRADRDLDDIPPFLDRRAEVRA